MLPGRPTEKSAEIDTKDQASQSGDLNPPERGFSPHQPWPRPRWQHSRIQAPYDGGCSYIFLVPLILGSSGIYAVAQFMTADVWMWAGMDVQMMLGS